MALGFPASYETVSDLVGDRASARAAVTYALNTLNWKYAQLDPDHFRARAPFSPQGWGETLSISIDGRTILIKSASILPFQVFDWGKNKQNVEAFLAHYLPKDSRDTLLRSNDLKYLDEDEKTPVQRVISD